MSVFPGPQLEDALPQGTPLRPEIALSWRRSMLAGLPSDTPPDRFEIEEFDPASRLLAAAEPVLEAMAAELDGTGYCIALCDQESRLVATRFGQPRLRATMENLGAVHGRPFLEATTGTNSIATSYELRRGIAVHGGEHYLEALKVLSCYGHPVIHPVTRRTAAVLDITCRTEDDNALLAPFLMRAVHDIEQRFLDTSREAERRMLAAFHAATLRTSHPVLALRGDGEAVLANRAAIEMLDGADHALLRGLAGDPASSRARTLAVELSSQRRVEVRMSHPEDGAGVLFELLPARAGEPRLPAPRDEARKPAEAELAHCRERRMPVLITGEPGTGRTTALRQLAGAAPLAALDARELGRDGERAWLAELERLVSLHTGLVSVESIHLLPDTAAARTAQILRTATAWTALTSAPAAELTGEKAALAAHCPARVDLPPLRARRGDLPDLARTILARHADARLRLTPEVLEVLAAHPWPGNLRELQTVLRDVAHRRSTGDVTVRDLPPAYQHSRKGHRLTPLERAEHDAIAAALRASGGNKARAAKALGISRTTLYSRIRALGVAAPPAAA